MKEVSKKSHVSERQVMDFRMSAIRFLKEFVKKAFNKCPISYSLLMQHFMYELWISVFVLVIISVLRI